MGLPMSYHHTSSTPYMDTFSTTAAAAAAQAAHAQVQAAQAAAAADQYTASAAAASLGSSSASAYPGHTNQTMNPYSASSSLLSSQVTF